ncbi:MAG: hypothetical protein ACFCUU_11600, partial [Cyclobacteriaceae bacterium]
SDALAFTVSSSVPIKKVYLIKPIFKTLSSVKPNYTTKNRLCETLKLINCKISKNQNMTIPKYN